MKPDGDWRTARVFLSRRGKEVGGMILKVTRFIYFLTLFALEPVGTGRVAEGSGSGTDFPGS